ncbi:hypothetical protein D3C77_652490 [compost metagenome]
MLEQVAGLVEVAGWVAVTGVVAHQRWRIGIDSHQCVAFAEQLVDMGLAIKGDVDRFTHAHVTQVFVFGIE